MVISFILGEIWGFFAENRNSISQTLFKFETCLILKKYQCIHPH